MSRVWFNGPLETVATFWRVERKDGVTLGFCTHDRDLWFDGLLHRAAPGMVPSAIRRSANLEPDSAEVEGVLSHDAITAEDLAIGRFDSARITIGLVDWERLDRHTVYCGRLGPVTVEAQGFSAALESRKLELQRDPIPRTSPTCRAQFCGPGCTLSGMGFSHEGSVAGFDPQTGLLALSTPASIADLLGGTLRWLDGPYAGQSMTIAEVLDDAVLLDRPIDHDPPVGTRVLLREGCDRTLATCAERFGNAVNFQGEPHLPGNDLITRYPPPAA